ncbi:MAG: helix-turn-helix domain-containing protein [Oscillospiraceae bacterium]
MLVVNGWKVGALRLGMNLSQEALAAKAGISPGQIQRIESGKTKM